MLASTSVASATAVAVACLIGAFLASMLFKLDLFGRSIAAGMLLLAAGIPVFAVNGALLSLIPVELASSSAFAVGLIHGIAHLPLATVIIGVALRMVPAEFEESALVDGAGVSRTLLRVTLRTASGGIIAAGVFVLIWSSTDYSVSDVLLVRTFAEEVYTQYALGGRPEEPTLVAVPQIVFLAALLWAFRRVLLTNLDRPVHGARPLLHPVPKWRVPLSMLAVSIPVGLVVLLVASIVRLVRPPSDAFHIALGLWQEVSVSFLSSVLAGIVAAVSAVGIAWFIVRRRRWRPLLVGYVIVMLAIPAPVLGMGLIRLFNRPGLAGWLYDSPAMLVVAYVVRFLPVAVLLLVPAIRAISRDSEDHARVDGADEGRILYRIVAPQCFPTMLLAAFVVMILSIGELPCSLLVTPPGYVTVATRFFSLVHYGMYPDAAMLCLLSVASVCLPSVGVYLLLRRRLVS